MMRNVNQVCGVLALIAVAYLVAFGSAGDRIVSAAPGQIAPAGDTGQAISIGGCNRCAWSVFALPEGAGIFEIAPAGTSGVFHGVTGNGYFEIYEGSLPNDKTLVCTVSASQATAGLGIRFTNGLTVFANSYAWTGILYRLD